MSDDYGYINARIRAMKSFLLREEDYITALRQRSSQEFLYFLGSLPAYSNDVRSLLGHGPERSLGDEALKSNMCRIFRKIIKFCEGKPKELILILLTPWDIYNLKTIIRGVINFKDRDEITQALIPAGSWDQESLTRLIELRDIKAIAKDLISAPLYLGREFSRLISEYPLDSPLELLENKLSEVFFIKTKEYLDNEKDKNAGMILDYLNLRIDFLNIGLAFKSSTHGGEGKGNFIKGGRISPDFLEGLTREKRIEDALKTFSSSPYPWLSQEGLELYKRRPLLSTLERLLRKKEFLFWSKLYLKSDPLSIAIPLSFINFKEKEINNLRFINKAIFYKMPEDLIREEILFA